MEDIIEIELPELSLDAMGYRGCHECDGLMEPCLTTAEYRYGGRNFNIRNVRSWKCMDCGEIIYSSAQAKLIEEALDNAFLESN